MDAIEPSSTTHVVNTCENYLPQVQGGVRLGQLKLQLQDIIIRGVSVAAK